MEPLRRDELAALDERLARGPVDLAASAVPALILARIRDRTPTAVVRFGEGEGRILAADPSDPESIAVAANKLRRQTGERLERDDVLRIKSLLLRSFDEADVVGLRGSASFSDEHLLWVRRLEALFAERVAAGREPAVVTHSLVSVALRDALGALLAGRRHVSVVSCRDIAGVVARSYGVDDVAQYPVPSQFVMRGVDGAFESALHETPFWPEFLFDLRRRLTVREPGEVFLVGAGILGKELIVHIRQLGGVGLDMGSCLDGLAGKVTRGAGRPPPYTRPPPVRRSWRAARRARRHR